MDYEAFDKAALVEALLRLGQCPKCRGALNIVDSERVGCVPCDRSWEANTEIFAAVKKADDEFVKVVRGVIADHEGILRGLE